MGSPEKVEVAETTQSIYQFQGISTREKRIN